MFETSKNYPPQYAREYLNQPIVYDGRNFILTLAKEGKEGEPYVIVNNGYTIKDPFCCGVPTYSNAWVFGLYYKLSDPTISLPKRHRIKRLQKRHPEFFGCQGLYDAGMELSEFIKKQMNTYEEIILIGFTKSANMILNHMEYSSNVSLIAICPMFKGTLTTMPNVLKKYLKVFYPIARCILTEHIVDEDISVEAEYVAKADYSKIRPEQVTIVMSSLDRTVEHSWTDVINPINLFFWVVSRITDKATRENQLDATGYKSNGFLSYHTQLPPFEVDQIKEVYASMPMTLNHPEVRKLICEKIKEKNHSFKQ